MSFQPFVSGTGLAGWTLLKSTLSAQKAAFNRNPQTLSNSRYFLEKFDTVNSAEDLVENRRLLRVVLGAYGLSEDINNIHFVKTLMKEGVTSQAALANKLSDQRYKALARDFDFSTTPPQHKLATGFAEEIVVRFQDNAFEIKIGENDQDMRLALEFSREFRKLSATSMSNAAGWYQVLATPPIREVMQTALGLPKAFAQLDIDDQHQRIKAKAENAFGTSSLFELSSEALAEKITRQFLVMRDVGKTAESTPWQTALMLLQAIPQRSS